MRLRAGARALIESVRRLSQVQEQSLDAQRQALIEIAALRSELGERQNALDERLALMHQSLDERLALVDQNLAAADTAVRRRLQELLDGTQHARERLVELRASPDYGAAWSDPAPLVSIVVPTYVSWQTLEQRAIPSALGQTYGNIEVIVVGDAAGDEVVAAMRRIDDPRVRFENLTIRGPYPEDPRESWYVAGSGPMNRAMELARGHWIAFLNDDDAMRPEHVEVLVTAAKESRAEVMYSKLESHSPDGSSAILGSFPPRDHAFGWQLAIHHSGLRIFEYDQSAALAGQPGDWHRARRMMLAGVRFAQVDRVTFDYYPSTLWRADR